MEATLHTLNQLKADVVDGWSRRILSQLEYAVKLSEAMAGRHDETIRKTVEFLMQQKDREGTITTLAAQKAEDILKIISPDAKSFQLLCAAHAHIDMNWMWRWDETVAVTLDTFRTMLDLMTEYPEFTFSQSQASVYRIVEEYQPAMLEEIKERIREGRWEVTASTWVETDKNMPSGESLARHILYTKRTLHNMLGIDPERLALDFEPDTFGHSLNVPEILARGGVKYYYHCRGYDGFQLYRWKAPSRSTVIVYREPLWYNAAIDPSVAYHVPGFCTQHGMDTMLKVYGVGNHGGGPTRRDIEALMDMAAWPVFPTIRFGTYEEFFHKVEAVADTLPVVNGELNFVFTGCYTSQSRIKAGNSNLENKLMEAEIFAAAAALSGEFPYPSQRFEKAWEKVLFNQFHDILPGSGTVDTREYAMGLYQEAAAIVNTEESLALQAIAARINTLDLVPAADIRQTVSEGAGVGFGLKDHLLPQTERGSGLTRIFHLFNSSLQKRREMVELTIWDWEGDRDRMIFTTAEGRRISHQISGSDETHYWGHQYLKVLIDAEVPPMGYTTCILKEKMPSALPLSYPADPRVERNPRIVLENQYLRIVFDPRTAVILAMTDKGSSQNIAPQDGTGIFRFIEEDDSRGMTSWIVGRYMRIQSINNSGVRYKWIHNDAGLLRQSLCYEASFAGSKLTVVISLDKHARALRFDVECDFHELGAPGRGIPQLNFHMPVAYDCRAYKYDVPSGSIEREPMDMDVPANSWAAAIPKDPGHKPLTITTRTKHGFRGWNNGLALTLIRGSYDPDPIPETGTHTFSFQASLPDVTSNRELIEAAASFNCPIRMLSVRPGKGDLLPTGSFMAVEEGTITVQAVKLAEDDDKTGCLIIRTYETEGRRTKAALTFCRPVKKAFYVDINERQIKTDLALAVNDNQVVFSVEPYQLVTLLVAFSG